MLASQEVNSTLQYTPETLIIEFLSQPGSDFGTEPGDVDLLKTPRSLCEVVRMRLDRSDLRPDAADKTLRLQLQDFNCDSVNWDFVAEQLRARLRLTDGFFGEDLPASANA